MIEKINLMLSRAGQFARRQLRTNTGRRLSIAIPAFVFIIGLIYLMKTFVYFYWFMTVAIWGSLTLAIADNLIEEQRRKRAE